LTAIVNDSEKVMWQRGSMLTVESKESLAFLSALRYNPCVLQSYPFFWGASTMSYRKILTCLTLIALGPLFLSFYGCSRTDNPWDKVEGGPRKVLVSFPPLYCFTKGVAGTDAKVLSLLAPTGPHGYSPGADDAHVVEGADLFLVNGLGLDRFVTSAVNTSGNKKIKIIEVAEKAIPEGSLLELGGHEHGGGAHQHEGKWDPHAWLGTQQAILMVKEIAVSLKEADADHAANYDKRAAQYIQKLKELQDFGNKLLDGKKNRKIIATHESLGYFCKSFNLDLVGSIMPRPGLDAGGPEMAALVELGIKEDVRIIAIEPQYKQDTAETLRKNLIQKGGKAVIVEIDPLETAPRDKLDAEYYFRVMRQNLQNLGKHMQ
jgi:zinc transport system substrate-binding protein